MNIDFLVIALPLLSAVLAGFGRFWLGEARVAVISAGIMALVGVASAWLFYDVAILGHSREVMLLARWIESGDMAVQWALRFDVLAVTMVAVVNIVSACVHVYALGYMHDDKRPGLFMSYLGLFTFTMLMLVTADNFLQLFFGWEGVGLASYLLIGFWYDRASANSAAIKAFVTNRVGDIGLILGIMGIFALFGSLQFDAVFADVAEKANHHIDLFGYQIHSLTLICLLLFIGAMGKSAQLGLHVWLPDAMEGPTPVSALIHAATMVTAGVVMLCRVSPILEYAPDALSVITIVGAITAFVAASIGLTQNDIKRVIAYSTMSQLGYMVFAVGVSAYGAAMFHLVTHAFFKALLFLSAGSVIHGLGGEQDLRRMGGIWSKMPITYVLMWIGSLALAGMPFFAGYYSKDIVLEATYMRGTGASAIALGIGIAAAMLTAFYSWRLLFLTFHGKPRMGHHAYEHAHESPAIMWLPMALLAFGAIFSGYLLKTAMVGENYLAEFWRGSLAVLAANDTVAKAHEAPHWIKQLTIIVGLLAIWFAWLIILRRPWIAENMAKVMGGFYRLSHRKWYFDEIYGFLFVRPSEKLGNFLWQRGDLGMIDAFGPNGVAKLARLAGARLRGVQSGFMYHYAFAMVLSLVLLLAVYVYGRFGG